MSHIDNASPEVIFKYKNIFFCRKNAILLVFDQSSLVHPVSDLGWGTLSVAEGRRKTEILVSKIG